MPFSCCKSRRSYQAAHPLVFVENVHYCSCSWLSHFVPHTGSCAAAAVAAEPQGRAGAVVAPQPAGTALCHHSCPRNALTVCVCPGLHVCFVCTCLQHHSHLLTASCFHENVASWANVLAYSQMERLKPKKF